MLNCFQYNLLKLIENVGKGKNEELYIIRLWSVIKTNQTINHERAFWLSCNFLIVAFQGQPQLWAVAEARFDQAQASARASSSALSFGVRVFVLCGQLQLPVVCLRKQTTYTTMQLAYVVSCSLLGKFILAQIIRSPQQVTGY